MTRYGFNIRQVSQREFMTAVEEAKKDETMNEAVLGLAAYDTGIGDKKTAIECDNRFTTALLYRLGFMWPIVDEAYIENSIRALDGLWFFRKN